MMERPVSSRNAQGSRRPREGWERDFERMAELGDDRPILPDDLAHAWDAEEWKW